MIVLPNSFEKYLYNLRIYTSLSILKHGILPRHLKNLKKIYLAEAFLFKNHTQPTDMRLLSYNLLDCIKNLKEFNFIIKINKSISINQKLYTALLLTIAPHTDFLKIEFSNGIIIKGIGEIKKANKVIAYLNGCSFFDLKTSNFLIYIPCKTTTLSPTTTITQWELIFDRFSVFNLFFE